MTTTTIMIMIIISRLTSCTYRIENEAKGELTIATGLYDNIKTLAIGKPKL
jgi:hypothetical protein